MSSSDARPPRGRSADLVVLGGGPAGLAAALAARRRGLEVKLLERRPWIGGLAASFEVAGQRVDHGSHRLHPEMPGPVRHELERLLGDDLQVRRRNGRLRLDRRWVAFPLRPIDLVTSAPPGLTVGFARDLATSWRRRGDGRASFGALARTRFGPALAERFHLPYARKLFGEDPDRLSPELFRRRVAVGGASGLLRRVAAGARPATRTFLYPRLGFGEVVERLAERAVSEGVELLLGWPVSTLRLGASGAEVGSQRGTVTAGVVVSTLPPGPMVGMVEAGIPDEVRSAAERLHFRSMLLVYLVLDRPSYTAFDAHYLPDPSHRVSRLSEPKNYRDGPDPPRRTVLCAEVPVERDDERWQWSSEALGDEVVAALDASGLAPVRPVAVEVRRVSHAYPVYRVGYEDDLAMVEAWVAAQPSVVALGRHALFAHDNTDHALTMGWALGGSLHADGALDRASWAAARDGFRGHVVRD